MDSIEITILKNLIHNEDYARKVIPFIQPEYFENRSQRIVFEEIVEFIVNENSKVLDKKIMDLDFPLTAIIGGVIRNNQGIIALGDFEIQLGDRVLVCSKPESIKKVESLFL